MTMRQDELDRDETASLISADKVEGTPVYTPDGERIGSISTLMIEKRSGRVAYAVMAFGGFLGIGEELTPLPWEVLRYDPGLGGYVVALPRETLREAPRYAPDTDWSGALGRAVDDHFGPARA